MKLSATDIQKTVNRIAEELRRTDRDDITADPLAITSFAKKLGAEECRTIQTAMGIYGFLYLCWAHDASIQIHHRGEIYIVAGKHP